MKKFLFNSMGFVLLAVGGIGIILPILPTTPFVLAASLSFTAGSPKFRKRLYKSAIFGEILQNYRENRGVSWVAKLRTIVLLWTGLSISSNLILNSEVINILFFIGLTVTLHIGLLKTKLAERFPNEVQKV